MSTDDVVRTIVAWADKSTPRVAVGINANSAYVARSDNNFADHLRRADLAYPDGQSVVWATWLLGGSPSERVATTDLIHPLSAALQRRGSFRYYLLGARPANVACAAHRLEELYPGLVTMAHDGYFSADEEPAIVEEINRFEPDVLLVGLGDPDQQRWVQTWRSRLQTGAIMTCGGLFDWLSGANRRAPAWMIRLGVEWLWRVMIEPRRLFKRYLLGNTWFVTTLVRQLISERLRRAGQRGRTVD